MSLSTMLDCTCTITRSANTLRANGGISQDYSTTVQTDMACSVQPASNNTIAKYRQDNINVTTQIYFEDDPGVKLFDKIIVTDVLGGSHTYIVQGVYRPLLGRVQVPFAVDCTETDNV